MQRGKFGILFFPQQRELGFQQSSQSQETAIVDFVKDHPELYDKDNTGFHFRHTKKPLWSEIAEELNLTVIDVKCWFES